MTADQIPNSVSNNAINHGRVAYLDGLRGIAIILVIAYHYFARFAFDERQIYPYADAWASFPPFQLGFYGVHLFFAISGFVIALSLERTSSIGEFMVRRFARLWPTMLLCSLVTYAVLSAWPRFWPQSPINFIPSLTFVDAQIWNRVVPGLDAQWIDGAYWSLFVEVRFYALAAIIYFVKPEKFHKNFNIFVSFAVILHGGLLLFGQPYWADLVQMAFVANYLPWFLLGIAALHDLRGMPDKARHSGLLAVACVIWLTVAGGNQLDLLALTLICIVLFLPNRVPLLNSILASTYLTTIGATSYSLYLLHHNAGLTLIAVFSERLGWSGLQAIPIPFAVALAFLALSRLIFTTWENPLNRKIVDWYAMAKSSFKGRAVS